jgi:hypothetical protein
METKCICDLVAIRFCWEKFTIDELCPSKTHQCICTSSTISCKGVHHWCICAKKGKTLYIGDPNACRSYQFHLCTGEIKSCRRKGCTYSHNDNKAC